MHQIHLPQCDSTQNYLQAHIRELKLNHRHILVSTDFQHQGRGRRGHTWNHFPNALAFSFTLEPLNSLTLTPLELGLLMVEFIKQEYNAKLLLKWPNDMLNLRHEKCGGIICNLHEDLLLVGIGINLGSLPENIVLEDYNFTPGSAIPELSIELKDKKQIPAKIYDFILKNRIPETEIPRRWNNSCTHLNRRVAIENHHGFFRGIGPQGEALVEQAEGQISKLISGSLTFL